MQEYFLHFSNVFLQLPKAELFRHFKNAEMFPTFWMQEYFQHFQMCFCSFKSLNCYSYILEMEEYFQQFFKSISAVEAVSMKTGIFFELSTPSISCS